MHLQRILIIQTAFIGDVILATPLVDKMKRFYPDSSVDFLVRGGNEGLFSGDTRINELLVWNKEHDKNFGLIKLIWAIRKKRYDLVINVQRFTSTGLVTFFSGAKVKVGFDKNPFSLFYTKRVPHDVLPGTHEVDRNLKLVADITDESFVKPSLMINDAALEKVESFKVDPYVIIAPTSVWFTKQFPMKKWVELIQKMSPEFPVYLIGGPGDFASCESIRGATPKNVYNLCGKLNLLESAALMKDAQMNYVNDSGPLHLASAVNGPVCAVFCSTIPDFGFGPLSEQSTTIQVDMDLECRPCHLHGLNSCPRGHFKCGNDIEISSFPILSKKSNTIKV